MADGVVFENQAFQLTLDTGVDISGEAGNVALLVTDPAGVETTITVGVTIVETTKLRYTWVIDTLTPEGEWQIKTYLSTTQTPGRTYTLSVLPRWERGDVPTVLEIREYLEGYCVTETVLSSKWIADRRNQFIIPWMEAKIGQPLGSTAQVQKLVSGTGSQVLILPHRPIISLDGITYVNVDPATITITLASVEAILDEGILRSKANFNEGNDRSPVFRRGNRNLRVTYTYGYADIPPLLKEAIMAFTAEKMLALIASRTGGGSSLSMQSYSRSFGDLGKYGDVRKDLARVGISSMKSYMTGTVGNI